MTNNHANSQTPNCFSILDSTFFLNIKKVDCIVRILSFYSNKVVCNCCCTCVTVGVALCAFTDIQSKQ